VAQQEKVLHSFFNDPPFAGVALDAAGNVYWTSYVGFYELTASSGYQLTTLYSLLPVEICMAPPP
jgi:hypothetical protein